MTYGPSREATGHCRPGSHRTSVAEVPCSAASGNNLMPCGHEQGQIAVPAQSRLQIPHGLAEHRVDLRVHPAFAKVFQFGGCGQGRLASEVSFDQPERQILPRGEAA